MRKRLIVIGNIQGVGYRALVKQIARALGVKGLVRNLDDGNVEIFCEGGIGQLAQFEQRINLRAQNGLFSANVDKIEAYPEGDKNYIGAPAEFRTFEIDYSIEAATPFEKSNLERLEIGILVMSEFKDETRQSFNRMDKKYDKMSGTLSETKDVIGEKLSETKDALGEKMDGVSEKLGDVSDKLSNVSSEISRGFADTQAGLKKEISEGFINTQTCLKKEISGGFKSTQNVFRKEFSKFRESNELLVKTLVNVLKK